MFSRIRVTDFQSIGDLDVPLGAFVVVTGETDSGKSALLRAIHALATNPTGQGFIRRGAAAATVAVVAGVGAVTWRKGASASYELSDGVVFDKARGVPAPVEALLRVAPFRIGDVETDPSFHRQFDTPFLLDVSGTVRAKILGDLTGVNLVYLAAQETHRRQLAAKRKIDGRQADIADLTERRGQYDWLDARADLLQQVWAYLEQADDWRRQASALREQARSFETAVDRASLFVAQRDEAQRIEAVAASVDFVAADQAADLREHAARLRAVAVALADAVADLAACDAQVQVASQNLAALPVCPTCGRTLGET